MSVIIRLQNLPWTANAMDIRHFFQGLNIPDGGVHIVGGDKGDAFIAFATDEDARQAMLRDRNKIKDNHVKLFLSSKTEMQIVIAEARKAAPGPPVQSDMTGLRPLDQYQGMGLTSMTPGLPDMRLVQGLPGSGLQILQNLPPGAMFGGPQGGFQPQAQSPPFNSRFGGPPVIGQPPHDRRPENGQAIMDRGRSEMESSRETSSRDRSERGDRRRRSRSRSPHKSRRDRSRDRSSRDRKHGERSSSHDHHSHRGHSKSRRDRKEEHKESRDNGSRSPRIKSPPLNLPRMPYNGPPTRCIVMRNIPHQAMYKEIRRFFRGLDIPRDGLKLFSEKNSRGRDAFVRFFKEEFALNATKMDGEMFMGEKLQIDLLSEEEFDRIQDTFSPQLRNDVPRTEMQDYKEGPQRNGPPPQIRGPLLERPPVHPAFGDQVEPGMPDRYGPPHGDREPYHGERPSADRYAPLEERRPPPDTRPPLGDHYPPADRFPPPGRPAPPQDYRSDMQDSMDHIARPPGQNLGFSVLVNNLPPDLQRDELRGFFREQKLVRGGMYIEYDINTVCLGRAYMEFLRDIDLDGALKKNGMILGGRHIEVVSINREVLEAGKRQHKEFMRQQHAERNGGAPIMREDEQEPVRERARSPRRGLLPHPSRSSPVSNPCVRLHGLPFSSTVETVLDFFHGIPIKPEQVKILYRSTGEASGIAFLEFNNPLDYELALAKDGQHIGKRYINITSVKKEDAQREIENFHNISMKGRGQGGRQQRPPPTAQAPTGNNTIYLQNLPYAVSPEEVLDFLRGFGAIPDSLRFREEGGKRTGEAMIALQHPGAVDRVLHELQGLTVRGRPITITT